MNIINDVLVLQVEVNLLTGETTILQSDIIYDCGQSLNPAVDLGQVGLTAWYFELKTNLKLSNQS